MIMFQFSFTSPYLDTDIGRVAINSKMGSVLPAVGLDQVRENYIVKSFTYFKIINVKILHLIYIQTPCQVDGLLVNKQ